MTEEEIRQTYTKSDEKGFFHTDTPLTCEGLSGGGYRYVFKGHNRLWRWPEDRLLQLDAEGLIYYPKTGKKVPRKKTYYDPSNPPMKLIFQDVWDDIPSLQANSKESRKYPTQKPEVLLQRIIELTTDPGDVVLDPCMGSGTTILAAQALGRKWVGIDISPEAFLKLTNACRDRFPELFSDPENAVYNPYQVDDRRWPTTQVMAENLRDTDYDKFEWWWVHQIRGAIWTGKGRDRGRDGYVYVQNGDERLLGWIQVKSGQLKTSETRGYLRQMEEESVDFIIFLCGQKPPDEAVRLMRCEREIPIHSLLHITEINPTFPKAQVITLEEWWQGKRPRWPEELALNLHPTSVMPSAPLRVPKPSPQVEHFDVLNLIDD